MDQQISQPNIRRKKSNIYLNIHIPKMSRYTRDQSTHTHKHTLEEKIRKIFPDFVSQIQTWKGKQHQKIQKRIRTHNKLKTRKKVHSSQTTHTVAMKWNETKRILYCVMYLRIFLFSICIFILTFFSLVGCSLFLCLYFFCISIYFISLGVNSYNIELFVTYSIRIFCSLLSFPPYDRRITRNKKLCGV